jgi:hypothetical protein
MKRLERLLAALLILLLLAVAALLWRMWQGAPGQAPRMGTAVTVPIAPTSVFRGETAQAAATAARAVALAWQPDAQLYQLSAVWPQGAGAETLRRGAATWGVTFYSPAAGAAQLITVVEGSAVAVETTPFQPDGPLADAANWRVDSDDAVAHLLDNGGDAFVRAAGVSTLTLTLTADGRLTWLMTLFAPGSGQALNMELDAEGGAPKTAARSEGARGEGASEGARSGGEERGARGA